MHIHLFPCLLVKCIFIVYDYGQLPEINYDLVGFDVNQNLLREKSAEKIRQNKRKIAKVTDCDSSVVHRCRLDILLCHCSRHRSADKVPCCIGTCTMDSTLHTSVNV